MTAIHVETCGSVLASWQARPVANWRRRADPDGLVTFVESGSSAWSKPAGAVRHPADALWRDIPAAAAGDPRK